MRSLAPHDRPREKLERLGAGALGDNELLAIVLGQGSRESSALDIANRVLEASGGVHGLTRVSREELRRIGGVGRARASQMLSAVELGRRTLLTPAARRPQFTTARDMAAHLIPQYGSRPVEQFGVVLLDTKLRFLKVSLLTVGTLDSSVVHPREVFREAAAAGAAAVVVFHNHPSGDPRPSAEDCALTRRLQAAGEIMGIELLDHLILADAQYCSFKESGKL
jgi:DNA repair protein RadC